MVLSWTNQNNNLLHDLVLTLLVDNLLSNDRTLDKMLQNRIGKLLVALADVSCNFVGKGTRPLWWSRYAPYTT